MDSREDRQLHDLAMCLWYTGIAVLVTISTGAQLITTILNGEPSIYGYKFSSALMELKYAVCETKEAMPIPTMPLKKGSFEAFYSKGWMPNWMILMTYELPVLTSSNNLKKVLHM